MRPLLRKISRVVLVFICAVTVAPLLAAAIAPSPQADGVSMSWEGLTAIGGAVLAAIAVMAIVWRGGQLSNQLESAQGLASELDKKVGELEGKIDSLTRVIYEMRGAMQADRDRGRIPSRQPLGENP